ncbi:MAG: DNA-3-methyladenine glycosylase [Chloroflexi bacterium]|nr:DNA-3-methyladenine glycosylase [Chloroflexota bacterium]
MTGADPGKHYPALPRSFFARPTEVVARELLGALLVRHAPAGLTVGRIVETEAYGSQEDRASHARAGLTRRTAPMFGRPGQAYVYLVYGLHNCLNVVAHDESADAGAVLLRAVEPLEGVELMMSRRGAVRGAVSNLRRAQLAAGPALVCQAMAIDRGLAGADLTTGRTLWLAAGPAVETDIVAGPRVGVDYAGPGWADRAWRFGIADHPALSRPFGGTATVSS